MKTTSPISSVSSSTLIDAKLEEHRVCRSNLCPSCGQKIDPKPDWIGLPAGVKFDPTDQELIEHLEAKVQAEDLRSHPLIDEFIPTLEGEDGICYTHPEKLPGVTRDGLSKHFFHRPSKAYTTGTRKRRKIQSECDLHKGETRWHKTGKTRPVMANGKQKGCKKILVLYTNFGKHRKPEKTNWVMHQYHLGEIEEEKEGELVVSKIFYQTQPRQCNLGERSAAAGAAITAVAAMERRREYSGSGGSCSSSKDGGHMRPPDNFSFAPFRESFNEVAMGEEAAKEARRDEHGEEEHRGKAARHHLAPPAAAAAAAAQVFHITRAPISTINVVSGATPPLQLSPLQGLEDPYRVSRMLFQADKSQHQQQQLQPQRQQEMDSISAAGLEELVMSCTTAGVKGEASINPHSQETEWQYSYSWSPDNPDHHG